jgi:4-amino-4-deoxychorismate lyase
LYWFNGQFYSAESLVLSVDEPGLLYGATIFTTLRVYQQSLEHPLTHWREHCERLQASLQALDWSQPSWNRVIRGAKTLLGTYPILRITIFPDGREWIMGRNLPSDLTTRQQQGIIAWLAKPDSSLAFQRSLPEHKTGNYLACWLAAQRSHKQDAQEAILVDPMGHWLETSTGNLWGWAEGQWWTPPLAAGILPGVARMQLINGLKRQNRRVGEISWSEDWVKNLEAIAYTNSIVEVVPIRAVLDGEQVIPYSPTHAGLEQLRTHFETGAPQVF